MAYIIHVLRVKIMKTGTWCMYRAIHPHVTVKRGVCTGFVKPHATVKRGDRVNVRGVIQAQ